MKDIVELIASLGNLHDAKILELVWRRRDRIFEMEIHNLYVDLVGSQNTPARLRRGLFFPKCQNLILRSI